MFIGSVGFEALINMTRERILGDEFYFQHSLPSGGIENVPSGCPFSLFFTALMP